MRKLLWISALSLTAMVCLTACDDSTSAKGDDGKENAEGKSGDGKSLLPDVSGEGCNFKKEDKVWGYTVNSKVQGVESTTGVYFIYNEKGSTDSVVNVSTGKDVTMACSYLGGRQIDEGSDDESAKVTTYTECKNGAMYISDVTQYKFEDRSRDEAFADVMEHCQSVNNYDKDKVQEALDEAAEKAKEAANKGGKDDDEEEEEEDDNGGAIDDDDDDNNGAIEGNDDGQITCDFNKSDDEWTIRAEGAGEMVVKWNTGKAVSYTKSDAGSAEYCQTMLAILTTDIEGNSTASCDGSYLLREDPDTFANFSRDQLYDMYCGS